MNTVHPRRGEMWVLMQARRLGYGRNPLRRRVDRIESMLILLAVLAGLLLLPIGAAVGTSVRKASEREAAQQRSLLQAVQARTVEDVPAAIGDVPGQVTARTRVVWQAPDGSQQEGRTQVFLGTKANSEITIWLDRSGAIAAPPRQPGDSAALGAAAGLTTVMGSWFLLWLLVLAARYPLERRRMRDWQDEWAQVAPLWTRRQT